MSIFPLALAGSGCPPGVAANASDVAIVQIPVGTLTDGPTVKARWAAGYV